MHNGPRRGGPGRGVPEKSKDFKKAMIGLYKKISKWHVLVAISILLATISAVMSLVAPNKLSDITDEVQKGLVPNITEETVKNIMSNPKIIESDKAQFIILLNEAKTMDMNDGEIQKEYLVKINDLPVSIYEEIKPKMNFDRIKKIAIFLGIIYLVSSIFGYIQSLIMANVSNNFAKSLRSEISTKINKLPLRFFDNHETGDILSRVTNDVDTMAQSMNQSLSSLVTNLTLFFGSIIMMFYTNWIMALTAIFASLFGFIFMSVILSKSQKYFTQRQTELGNLNSHIEEIYSGHNVVKVYNASRKGYKHLVGHFYRHL